MDAVLSHMLLLDDTPSRTHLTGSAYMLYAESYGLSPMPLVHDMFWSLKCTQNGAISQVYTLCSVGYAEVKGVGRRVTKQLNYSVFDFLFPMYRQYFEIDIVLLYQ